MRRLIGPAAACIAAVLPTAPGNALADCGRWGTAAFWDSPVGERDVRRCLHEFGRDPNEEDGNGDSPLHGALRSAVAGDGAVPALLGAGADPTATDAGGWTPLHLAVFRGKHRLVGHLLGFGANPDARTRDGGLTPLHLAALATEAGSGLALDALLRSGADPNARDPAGQTPLHYAVAGSDAGKVRRLLRRGADPDARGADGFTPLHAAALLDGADVAGLLLGAGADPNAKDDQGRTPLDISLLWGTPVAGMLQRRGGSCAKWC